MSDDAVGTFGELLKAFRQRCRWTQQQLAERLGVNRNTIGNWELGNVLPASKGQFLELARLLRLTDLEARQLFEASLLAPAPSFLVPLPRNPFFTGREEILEALHTHLRIDQVVALTQSYALQGLGGIGKTQVAREYIYRHALEYSAVFWIEAETAETLASSLLRMAELLQLPERREADQHHIVAAVQHWLSTHRQWLLIWDNLEDLDLLPPFLPPDRQGTILITTRHQALGTLARGMNLSSMEPEEGLLFLLRRAKVLEPEASREQVHRFVMRMPLQSAAAADLVTALGGLPLALDQAGAYIEETGCSFVDYLQRYEQQGVALLDRRGVIRGDHPLSVVATLGLACQRVALQCPAALELVHFCAFLYPDAIPEEILVAGATHLGLLGPTSGDFSLFDGMIAALRSVSLVQRHPETRTLSLHRLVQAVIQEALHEQERAEVLQQALHTLNALFPESLVEQWDQCERLLPHVLTVATATSDQAADQDLAELLRKSADYLRTRYQFQQAESLYQRAFHLWEHRLEQEDQSLLLVLLGLGHLHYGRGQYEQAEPLYKRALQMRERLLGSDHPQTAISLSALGMLYCEQGKYEQAEHLQQRALHILEQTLEPGDQRIALSLLRLGNTYYDLGKDALAKSLYQRALHMSEQATGLHMHHDTLALVLHDLGALYHRQGKQRQAEEHYKRALGIWTQEFGEEYPQAAFPLKGLADLCLMQGREEAAECHYQRALTILERAVGADHPDVARCLQGLARLCYQQGREEQARVLLERACTIFEGCLSHTHPEIVKARDEYRRLFEQKSGDPETPSKKQSVGFLQKHRIPLSRSFEEENEADPLSGFLTAYCEFHPRAWCRSASLWQAYEQWARDHQERFLLSRRAFIAQLKKHGCHADRTSTARIWRGITLVTKEP